MLSLFVVVGVVVGCCWLGVRCLLFLVLVVSSYGWLLSFVRVGLCCLSVLCNVDAV